MAKKVNEEVHIIIFIISTAEGREEVVQNLERKPFQVCSHATLAAQLHLLLHCNALVFGAMVCYNKKCVDRMGIASAVPSEFL